MLDIRAEDATTYWGVLSVPRFGFCVGLILPQIRRATAPAIWPYGCVSEHERHLLIIFSASDAVLGLTSRKKAAEDPLPHRTP